jgi:hypothetical protein
MSYFSQNKTTLWILAALVLFNVAAIITIFIKMNGPRDDRPCMREERGCFQDFLKKELNLTPAQALKFEDEKTRYHDTMMNIHRQMMSKRESITIEMTKKQADTSILNKTSDELGVLYSTSRKLYISHFFNLSKLCDSNQQKKLGNIVGNIFCSEGREDVVNPGKRHHGEHPKCGPRPGPKF